MARKDSDSKLFRSMLITSMIGMKVGTCHSAMMSSSWSTVKSPATNTNSLESNMHRIKERCDGNKTVTRNDSVIYDNLAAWIRCSLV